MYSNYYHDFIEIHFFRSMVAFITIKITATKTKMSVELFNNLFYYNSWTALKKSDDL